MYRILLFLLITVSFEVVAESPTPFVPGSQFKDLILPMPIINGLESEGIWGNENVIPRDKDNGMEDNEWCYWGGNPIKGKDGKYHIAVCRWPESTGHNGWFNSEVAHCVSDNPFGPYKVTGTIVKKGHNPEVLKLPDGTFVLHTMNNEVYLADTMSGPWKLIGTMKMQSRGLRENHRMGSNITTEYRPDGSIILMKKDGDIAISNTGILGPYKMVSIQNYARGTGYAEDPVIWRSRHQYHCIYNHAQDRRSAYMRSLDGIHWKNEYGVPYDASTTFYTDGTKNTWYKFERPKVLQDDLGRATHLSLAVMDVSKGQDKGNDNHSSKNMIMPLVTEKIISIVGTDPITHDTKRIALKIKSEDGFNAQTDMDMKTLRFGSDSVVNDGGGCKPVSTKPDGEDLIVYFEGDNGITHQDYDFKLIGRTKSDDLVFGYALLPEKSPMAASLIAMPIRIKEANGAKVLESAIENWGLSDSKAQTIIVYVYSENGRKVFKELPIPSIKPHGSTPISVPLGKDMNTAKEYEIIIPGTPGEYWQTVDVTDKSVAFTGEWKLNPKPNKKCFLNSEMVSTTFGDAVTYTFHGTRARAYGRTGRGLGTFKVFVDGEYLETVRCNYAPRAHEKIFQTPFLSDGKHVLKLEKVEADFNGDVYIDSFSYESVSAVSANDAGGTDVSNQGLYSFPEYGKRFTYNELAPILVPGKVLYVSAEGSDQNAGTESAPFRTLEAARDAIRQLKAGSGLPDGGVEVVLLDGNYQISRTFELSEEDSGTAAAPIVYRGQDAGKVILTGGVELDTNRLKLVSDPQCTSLLNPKAVGQVMSMDLSSDNLDGCFPGEGNYGQISMDGHLLQIAQWPNRGYYHIDQILEKGPTTRWLKPDEKPAPYSKDNPTGGVFKFKETLSPAVQKEFERTGDMRAQGYFHNDWYFQDEPVGAIKDGKVQLLRYTRYGIENKIKSIPRRVRLLNVLAELDEPGEWYYDKQQKRLYVWPIEGFKAGQTSLTVIGGQMISINGSFQPVRDRKAPAGSRPLMSLKNTEYVTIRDMIIEGSGQLAVQITGGQYNLLAGCTVRNGIGKGVVIGGGKHNGITGCDFYDLYSAFSISGGDWRTLDRCYNFAANNIIRHCRYRGYGVVGLSGVGIYFGHNLLHSMNGAVMYETTDMLMEYNEFYNIGYEMGDFNVAYCGAQWHTMGNVVRYNFVHHLLEPGGHPVCAFRNDDGGAGLKIYGNVFYRPGRGAAQFHGPLNAFQNNITMDCSIMWWTNKSDITPEGIQKYWDDLSRFGRELPKGDKGDHIYIAEQLLGEKAWLKSPWIDEYPEMKKMIETNPWAQTFCNVSMNYAYKVKEKFHIHGGSGTVEGMESKDVGRFTDLPKEGVFELPKPITLDAFVDVPSLDFRFKDGFAPMEGFEPIPFEQMGLVKDEFRPNPPDKKQYRSAVYERFKDDHGGRYDAAKVNARYPKPSYMP